MSLLKTGVIVGVLMSAFSLSTYASDAEVVFAGRVAKDLPRIERIEQQREKFFRENRQEGARRVDVSRIDSGLFVNAEFANERMIPNLDDFSVQALANAMAAHSFDKVEGRQPGENLKVEIDNLSIQNYSLARYSQGPTRMKGTISIVDEAGNVTRSADVSQMLLPQWTNNRSYQGSEYAYLRESRHVRIGPMIASFLKDGLEKLYPGSDVPGPIFIQR